MKWRFPLLGVLSGCLMALAIPNEIFHYGNPYIAPFVLVPLFVALVLEPRKAIARLTMICFSVSSSLLIYFWLGNFLGFSVWTVTGVAAGQLLYALAVLPFLFFASKASPHIRPFLFALGWVALEYMRSIGYIGFPWGHLAYPYGGVAPFVQIADVAGFWAVSLIVALANALIAETLLRTVAACDSQQTQQKSRRNLPSRVLGHHLSRSWGLLTLVVLANLAYGTIMLNRDIPAERTMRAVLVQQNLDPWAGGTDREALQKAQILTREALAEFDGNADIVLWSESSLRNPFNEYRSYYAKYPVGDPFVDFLAEIQVPLLLGGPYVLDWDKQKWLNAAILIGTDGEITDYYGKQHPVPFAEHIPFYEYEVVSTFFREVVGLPAIWTMGTEHVIFRVPGQDGGSISFGAPICFEDSFPTLNREFLKKGADLLINITNDSWSKTISAETQHFAAARFRSIENRTVLVRSSNSGVTAVVDPWGRVIASLPLFEEGYLATEIPIYKPDNPTIYTTYGDYFPIGIWLTIFLYLLAVQLKQFAKTRRTQKNR